MRLAVFTSKYPARVATFFERDMRGLLEAGIEIDIFPIYPLDSAMWGYSLGILNDKVLPRNRIHHISLPGSLSRARSFPTGKVNTFLRDLGAVSASAVKFGPMPLAKSVYVFPKALAWAKEHGNKYDHILAYWGNYAATCAYAFHRLIKRPVPFSIWLHAGADLYSNPIYLEQKLLYADNIVTCCAFNRKFIESHHPELYPKISDKINVCYHGIDLAEFPYEPDGRPPRRVIAVGRLSSEKGFDYLIKAAGELKRRGKEIEIDLVGDGEETGSLKALAGECGIADKVRFRGWLSFKEVQAAMRQATVLVHPSDGLGDGLPNVIREAMALGTPVIASEIAGIPEALDRGRCGILVPPKDVSALASAIDGLLEDPERRRSFADLGRKRVEDMFDLWRNGARLADQLRSVKRTT